jgi:hypothetical protein
MRAYKIGAFAKILSAEDAFSKICDCPALSVKGVPLFMMTIVPFCSAITV